MRNLVIVFISLFLVGCTTLYKDGEFKNDLLRTPISDKHGTMERMEGTGIVVKSVGENVAPEIYLGKYAHTQLYLPLVTCTTTYLESGAMDKTICNSIPSWTVEAQASAQGGRLGDIIKTGDATKYGSSYEAWIATLQAQIRNSNLDIQTKSLYIQTLDDMKTKILNDK